MCRLSKSCRVSLNTMVCSLLFYGGANFCPKNAFTSDITQVPLVGIDPEGNSKAIYISSDQYLDKMSSTLLAVNEGVLPQLNQRSCEKETYSHFELTTVTVALGIEFQAGLGALFSVSTGGKMQLVYANEFDPVIPE